METMGYMLAFGLPGHFEWLVILVVAVLLFGRRLPDIARSMGKSITEFKKGIKEAQNDITKAADVEETKRQITDATNEVNRD